MDKKTLGQIGEKVAAYFLEKKGYKILEKNYLSQLLSGPKRGEIDIICQKGEKISFVEVKTLNQKAKFFSPEEKVDWQKQKRLVKTAKEWLVERKIPLESNWQIDVLAIKIDPKNKKAKIRHFENIIDYS